jgi:hypothetical protein
MFIGHYAASMTARTGARRLPLWLFVAAAQLLDILWGLFMMLGVERAAPDPGVVEGLAFTFYPYSHSLVAALLWSAAAAWLTRLAFRADGRGALLVGLVVLSHWLLDFLVHRPDMPIGIGGDARFGLGLWNYPSLELALEIALFALVGAFLLRLFRREGRPLWPLAAFLLFGAAFMIATRMAPPPSPDTPPAMIGAMAVAMYLLFTALAWGAERPPRAGAR